MIRPTHSKYGCCVAESVSQLLLAAIHARKMVHDCYACRLLPSHLMKKRYMRQWVHQKARVLHMGLQTLMLLTLRYLNNQTGNDMI